jgi:hypothetical protein
MAACGREKHKLSLWLHEAGIGGGGRGRRHLECHGLWGEGVKVRRTDIRQWKIAYSAAGKGKGKGKKNSPPCTNSRCQRLHADISYYM